MTCAKNKHKWDYYRSICYVRKLDTISEVPFRECERCGKTEWKLFDKWEKDESEHFK